MTKTVLIVAIIVVVGLAAGLGLTLRGRLGETGRTLPTPSPAVAVQLPEEKQPQVELGFSPDGHYVTVNLTNLNADQLEYNLIYEATVKNSRIQTGVNSTADISGRRSFSQRQLLGSESSGKFTYHTDIGNAVMELTLRDSASRSIFTAIYSFSVTPGESAVLGPSL